MRYNKADLWVVVRLPFLDLGLIAIVTSEAEAQVVYAEQLAPPELAASYEVMRLEDYLHDLRREGYEEGREIGRDV